MVVQGSWAGRASGFFWKDCQRSKESRLAEQRVIYHPTLPREKHRVKKLWVRKLLRVLVPTSFLGRNSPPNSLELNVPGFAWTPPCDILELTTLWGSLDHHWHFLDVLKVFLTVNQNWYGSYQGSWKEWGLYSILVSLIAPTTRRVHSIPTLLFLLFLTLTRFLITSLSSPNVELNNNNTYVC